MYTCLLIAFSVKAVCKFVICSNCPNVKKIIETKGLYSLSCTHCRCTSEVFSICRRGHAGTCSVFLADTCCSLGTERQGYERGPTVELKSHLFSFVLLLGRASPHLLCFDVLEESWRGQNYLPLHSLILGLVPGISSHYFCM